MEVAGPRLHIRPMTGLPLLHVEDRSSPARDGWSRGRRPVAGDARVPAGLPLLAVLWAAVRSVQPGPAIFKQVRTGRDGKEFTLLKFRSMYVDAESGASELEARNERAEGLLFKIRNDPRVTPVGRSCAATR
jgi:lipopolysaccharide/colanic/teichoic acid biosynthesis glycosyltransferase